MSTISIKDETSVNEWIAQSEELTEKSNTIMKGVASLIQEIGEESKGDMVSDLVNASNGVLEGTEKLVSVMEQITGTINQVMSTIASGVDNVKEVLGGILGMFS